MVKIGYIPIESELRVYIKAFPGTPQSDQSIVNGTQNNLTKSRHKVVRKFIRHLSIALDCMLTEPWKFQGIWSTTMHKNGYHVIHRHPEGWMSGVCYVDIPDNTSGIFGCGVEPFTTVVPTAGKLVLFESWVPHWTTEYLGDRPRLSIAFDLVKK